MPNSNRQINCRIPNVKFQVPGSLFQVPNSKFQVSCSKFRASVDMKRFRVLAFLSFLVLLSGCVPEIVRKTPNTVVPAAYPVASDTTNTAGTSWRAFYADSNLTSLVDSALQRNQELNIVMQEIDIAQNEVDAKLGEILPSVEVGVAGGVEKVGTYTRNGAVEENLNVAEGQRFPTPLPDLAIGASVTWEVDIWRKLRNAKDAAAMRYLSTIEGTHYMVTNLVAEIASSYYELMSLDNLLIAVNSNIDVQTRALRIVQQQKEAAQATELAVKKFEAEVLKNESHRFEIQQRITETENHINMLCGRFPQPIARNSDQFLSMLPDSIRAGVPTQLLANRPDVKQAEFQLRASDLDIDVAMARYYPALTIIGGGGVNAISGAYLFTTPESLIYSLAGELMMPLLNRKAITAAYFSASARQHQAAYSYEQTILRAYTEVSNLLSKINNLQKSYERKTKQVEALMSSVDIAGNLFMSARADYMEVLLTQRDALEARMELIETKVQQMHAYVTLYQALGGGWK